MTHPDPARAPIVLVPGDRFFVKTVVLDPAAGAAGQVEIALEESSPFPLAQVYHGYVTNAAGTHAVAYAAYRRRFTADEIAAWSGAEAVLPDFVALLGRPDASPSVVVNAHPGGLNGAAWDGAADWPTTVLAHAVAGPAADQTTEFAAELRRQAALPGAEVQLLLGATEAVAEPSGAVAFRIDGREVFRLSAEALAAADVRDKSFLESKRREDRHRRGWWLGLVATGALALVALGADLAAGGLALWNHRRAARIAAQVPEVQRIETAQTVAARVADLTARQQRPLEWLARASQVRPRSIQFLRATSRGSRALEIEVQTANAADAGAYEAALRQLPDVERVETQDLRIREGLTTFVVALKFKPIGAAVAGGQP